MFGSMFPKKDTLNTTSDTKGNVSVRSPEELKQLEKMITTGPVTFVFVHADWCGHCQTYKPIWDELLNVPGRANMGMIHHDMVEKSSILKDAKIPGYPTVLKVYPNGRIENYKGENDEMTNAVPNMRNAESMKKELLAMPVLNMTNLGQAKAANTSANSIIKSIVLTKRNNNQNIQNLTKMNKASVVNTLLRKNNKNALKSNLLESLNKILENNKQLQKSNKKNNNNILRLPVYASSPKTKRNIANRMPSLAVRNIAVAPRMNELSIGSTKVVPPMMGGSLFVALTQAIQQAGPTAALLLANGALQVPPKKSRGSTMRRTRKSKAQSRR